MAAPHLSVLDESELQYLRSEVVNVLERVGARFESRTARDVLAGAGCRVDHETQVVRVPPDLVEWAVSKLRRDVLLAARDPARDAHLDGRRTFVTSTGICPFVVDEVTGEHRDPGLADLQRMAGVMDALDEVGLCWYPVTPRADAPEGLDDLVALACFLTFTGKHIQGELVLPEDVPVAAELLRLAAPDCDLRRRPLFSSLYCPVSPLTHAAGPTEAGMAMAAAGIPMDIFSLPLAGATSSITLAGTLVQLVAEELSAAVLFKLVDEEVPLILSAVASVIDMQTAASVTGAPEIPLMSVALIELVHSLGAPALAGVTTMDASDLGFQGGLETMGLSLPTWLARPDIAVGLGGLAAGRAVSLPKMVLDAEVVGYCARITDGITIDTEHTAVDVIADVGSHGHFLDHRSTRRSLRSGEHWFPRILRRTSGAGGARGQSDLTEATRQRIEEVLASHRPLPLPDGADDAIEGLLAETAAERGALR